MEVLRGIYRHFKGTYYIVQSTVTTNKQCSTFNLVAKHTETGEDIKLHYDPTTKACTYLGDCPLVLYHSSEEINPQLWVRPLDMFNEEIVRSGKRLKRFEHILAF